MADEDYVKTLARCIAVWAVVWLLLIVAGHATSTGEPVCDGPLIVNAADSWPPQCNTVFEGLGIVAPRVFGAGLPLAIICAFVLHRRRLVAEPRATSSPIGP